MEDAEHRSKRRRLDHDYDQSNDAIEWPDSSSDELAADSERDSERRRASWSAEKKVYTPRRSFTHPQQLSESESPDELAADIDADVYSWHRRARDPRLRMRSRSSSQDSRRTDMSSQDDDLEMRYDDPVDHGNGNGIGDSNHVERSPTPPPPKPERLNYREKFLMRGHLRGVSAVQFSPDGSMIASAGADGSLMVWDTRMGKLIHTFEGHLAGISTVAWSPDGATIASGSDDKTIRLWNVLTGKAHPVPFVGHHNYVYQIAFSPKGNILVSGSYDEAVFLWDVRTARVMRSLPAHSDPVAGVDVVRDGTLIVSCALDGLIRIWDTMTGQCLRTLVHDDNPPVTAVKFSPNGKFVLAWTLDDCVRLWDYVEGRCLKTYQGHRNLKYSLGGGFGIYGAPGGRPEAFAVSGSEDGTILCWDVVSKKVLQRIEAHTDVVLCVDTTSVDNKRLMVSCGLDRTIRVWEEVDEVGDVAPLLNGDFEEPVSTAQSPSSIGLTTGVNTPSNNDMASPGNLNGASDSDADKRPGHDVALSGDGMVE